MIERTLEALFRYKWLILFPPIVIPAIVGIVAFLTAASYYESWTGIWVDRPTYLANSEEWDRYLTPSQHQSRRLSELLRTRTFAMDVASRTSLAPLVGTPTGEERIQRFMAASVGISTNGNHLLVLSARSPAPRLSWELITGLIDAFKEKSAADQIAQAGLATSFYESQLQAAEEQLSKSNAAMRRYLLANPRLAQQDAPRSGIGPAAIDPQLADLTRRLDFEQREVDRARSSLEGARLNTATSLEGQELGFQVVDPPQVQSSPTREGRRALLFAGAGLLAGLILSVIILVVLVAADRSVRSEADLAPATRFLGVIPSLQPRGISQVARRDRTRRAIGFAAGTALLPAPSGGE